MANQLSILSDPSSIHVITPEDLTQIPDPPTIPNQDLASKHDATAYAYILSLGYGTPFI